MWLDPELPSRSLDIMNSLYERIDCYEQLIASNKIKETQLKKLVKVQMSVILFLFFCFFFMAVRGMGTNAHPKYKALDNAF